MKLLQGDSLYKLKELDDNSIDAVVTDPPYGLSFMGKRWDYDVPSSELWTEVLRVLKPGGHLLAFFGTRTYHRGVVRIEDAGFEIRDQIQWIYGSGFPKSLDVSKAIDKAAGAEREVIGSRKLMGKARKMKGGNFLVHEEREETDLVNFTAPATDLAKTWQGWGTALKPANEPIVVARKPLEKGLTVAENVVKWGTGAINVDGCRIEGLKPEMVRTKTVVAANAMSGTSTGATSTGEMSSQGRWPANVLFDEDAAAMLDEQSGKCRSAGNYPSDSIGTGNGTTYLAQKPQGKLYSDSGGASRFFYVAKASKRERNAGLDSSDLIWESEQWQKQDLKSAHQDMLELAKATSEDTLTVNFSWNIEQSGPNITDQFPKDLIFTISTVLKTIIELKTLSASQNLNTKENIQGAIRMIEANGLSLAESAVCIKKLLPSITDAKTESALGAVLAALPMLLKIKGYAKANNFHSTVKPIKLMQYLIKLVTPPNGTVLDPFMGSGSTGVVCKDLGLGFIGIELSPEYFEIAKRRIDAADVKE